MEVRVRPRARAPLLNARELFAAKDLLVMLVWRDFAVRYKQTLLGPIWFLLQPILPTLVFMLVFNRIAGLSTEGTPAFLFFFCNQIVWGFFAGNFTTTSNVLTANLALIGKVYFPRLVLPLAAIVSNGMALLVQLLALTLTWLWFRYHAGAALHVGVSLLLVPLVLLLAALQGLGFGLWMASVTAKYRDLQQLSGVIIQLWMYGSAVIFPYSTVPVRYRTLLQYNPLVFTVEAFRYCVTGTASLSWQLGALSLAVTAFVLVGGLHLFNTTARTYVDIA